MDNKEFVILAAKGSVGGAGLSDTVKDALLDCFANVAWATENGQQYYDALEAALYPPADLLSISAVFEQGETVIYDTDSLDALKSMLTVTANYDDGTSKTVTDYTLSGTLTVGTSTITVSYGGKTATFNVAVSAPQSESGYVEIGTPQIENNILTGSEDGFVRTPSIFNPGSDPWLIRVRFHTASGTANYMDVLGSVDSSGTSQRGLLMETKYGLAFYAATSGASSWDILSGNLAMDIATNTDYIVDFEYTGTEYRRKYSTDGGETWSDYDSQSSAKVVSGNYYVGFGLKRNEYLRGTIDLAECKIWINGSLWWQAVE